MKTKCYLTVNSRGGGFKATTRKTAVESDEVIIEINLDIPDELFRRPQIVVTIESKETLPVEIEAKTQEGVRKAIEFTTGQNVKIEVVRPEDGE